MTDDDVVSAALPHRMSGAALCARDAEIILAHQHAGGAYPAAPTFPPYRYAWFRDGAFIAYAMDVAGEHESARRFHAWAVDVVLRHRVKARRALDRVRRGLPLGSDYLRTRYTVEGEETGDEWPNFQLDGFGTWMWALDEHVRRTFTALPPTWEDAVTLVAEYLAGLWRLPCYDLWEEDNTHLHTYTLAAIVAGLRSAAHLVGGPWQAVAEEIGALLKNSAEHVGYFTKHIAPSPALSPSAVDASLIGLVVPYAVVPPEDPHWQKTLTLIEANLCRPGGGVYRYVGDTYYGGGEWTLLAAWLAWYYSTVGQEERARSLVQWVEAQADEAGFLPEQVTSHAQKPSAVAVWEQRWGPVARPLLWAHAMHLIVCHQQNSPA